MIEEFVKPNDPEEMKKSSKFSYLCKEFQKENLNANEKIQVLRSLIDIYRLEKELANV